MMKPADKRERRKERGLFYTPESITSYMVQETLGRFLRERTYSEISRLKILDPACGPGAFLIRAYEELLSYHAFQRGKSISQLEPAERLRILSGNIFGVDLDKSAVETARLNLWSKSRVEDELQQGLSENIKCGNALVSGPAEQLKTYFGEHWEQQVPFNWEKEFAAVMNTGGFDLIIGNPPWVSLSGKHKSLDITGKELQYFIDNYDINTSAPNFYEIFIVKALSLLKTGGLLSFIVPDRLSANRQFIKLRTNLLTNYKFEELFFRYPFPGVVADTLVFVIRKVRPLNPEIYTVDYPSRKKAIVSQSLFTASADRALYFIDPQVASVFDQIRARPQVKRLKEVVESTSGCGARSGVVHKKKIGPNEIRLLKGKNISRYSQNGGFWFEFALGNLSGRTRNIEKLGQNNKVLIRKTGLDIVATLDDSGAFPDQSLYFLYGLEPSSLTYLCGILNSNLINSYYRHYAITNRGAVPHLKKVDLDEFPIVMDNDNRDEVINKVVKMLELNKELSTLQPSDRAGKERIEREIQGLDNDLNDCVYNIYGLNPEERQIIKGGC